MSFPFVCGVLRPNRPTDFGREAGRELARLIETTQHPALEDRCKTCAFRAGTAPNGCEVTIMDALWALADSTPFYCHHGVAQGAEPTKLCAGWVAGTAEERFEINATAALSMHDRLEAKRREEPPDDPCWPENLP